ncbi:hypothetical protein DFP72DRAFT_1047535 [Ephemerocybe angulata]|uniref:Uncharacterized protein n=1 Tax=Ephemerocybe angulata TaxID=980116 RepID=A0A8H6HT72_9AGAR|nr:hypothetical protein DFP72DRAFT_1047535 [Tulosesus angulatus]
MLSEVAKAHDSASIKLSRSARSASFGTIPSLLSRGYLKVYLISLFCLLGLSPTRTQSSDSGLLEDHNLDLEEDNLSISPRIPSTLPGLAYITAHPARPRLGWRTRRRLSRSYDTAIPTYPYVSTLSRHGLPCSSARSQ